MSTVNDRLTQLEEAMTALVPLVRNVVETQGEIVKAIGTVVGTQKRIVEAQDAIVETQKAIIGTLNEQSTDVALIKGYLG